MRPSCDSIVARIRIDSSAAPTSRRYALWKFGVPPRKNDDRNGNDEAEELKEPWGRLLVVKVKDEEEDDDESLVVVEVEPHPSGPAVDSMAARLDESSTTRRTWKLTWQTMKLDTLKRVAMRLKGTSAWMEPSIQETPSTSKGLTTPWRSLASRRWGRRMPGRAQEAATAEASVTWGVVMWFIRRRWTESAWPSARWAETEMQSTFPVFSWAS
mmetsp:Transcript_37641/g.120745  ORF Transcript_37641/g.120745 Transcript_37641/m.120745 type:complete len:213 (+) Transcript_37641:1139-1777(+)